MHETVNVIRTQLLSNFIYEFSASSIKIPTDVNKTGEKRNHISKALAKNPNRVLQGILHGDPKIPNEKVKIQNYPRHFWKPTGHMDNKDTA